MALAIAHRGVPKRFPENTMVSFAEALRLGADMIELDVQRTQDGHLVIIHDDVMDRTSNGNGPVRAQTLAQLKSLDFGGWYDPRFAGERIPTLAELVDLVRGKAQLNVELKSTSALDPGFEAQVLAELKAADFLDDCILSCFDFDALQTLRRENPTVRLGALYDHRLGRAGDVARWADEQTLQALHPHFAFASPMLVRAAHARGMQVNVWTVDKPILTRVLLAVGVDGIITNSPEILQLVKSSQS